MAVSAGGTGYGKWLTQASVGPLPDVDVDVDDDDDRLVNPVHDRRSSCAKVLTKPGVRHPVTVINSSR